MIDKGYSVYSQFGEDGILQYLISVLNLSNKQCCEFGMSGIIFSNTYNLVENYDWVGIYIEKNKSAIAKINKGFIINKEVDISGENSLDNILKEGKLLKKTHRFGSVSLRKIHRKSCLCGYYDNTL